MTPTTVFVTGATGTIGRFLVARLTAAGHRVLALVREAAARRAELEAWIDAHGGRSSNLVALDGDLTRDGLGLGHANVVAEARLVFHLGAAVTWGLRPREAHEVNVRGTERVLALAAGLPALRRFVLVSGYGVGLNDDDAPVKGGGYETTKVEADRRARAFASARGMPLTRVLPGAVIGDAATGETLALFGFGDLVEMLVERRLPAIPGGPRHWMPLITVDYVADFLALVPFSDRDPSTEYYLVDQATPDLASLVRKVADYAGVRAPKRRVPMTLAKLVARAGSDQVLLEGLQFLSDVEFDSDAADRAAAAHGLVKPDLDLALRRSVAWLLRTKLAAQRAS